MPGFSQHDPLSDRRIYIVTVGCTPEEAPSAEDMPVQAARVQICPCIDACIFGAIALQVGYYLNLRQRPFREDSVRYSHQELPRLVLQVASPAPTLPVIQMTACPMPSSLPTSFAATARFHTGSSTLVA